VDLVELHDLFVVEGDHGGCLAENMQGKDDGLLLVMQGGDEDEAFFVGYIDSKKDGGLLIIDAGRHLFFRTGIFGWNFF
jgi:hypothetical protein